MYHPAGQKVPVIMAGRTNVPYANMLPKENAARSSPLSDIVQYPLQRSLFGHRDCTYTARCFVRSLQSCSKS
jgi:hypothetical protein